jgi:uncharacterized protein (TIGR01615 family)
MLRDQVWNTFADDLLDCPTSQEVCSEGVRLMLLAEQVCRQYPDAPLETLQQCLVAMNWRVAILAIKASHAAPNHAFLYAEHPTMKTSQTSSAPAHFIIDLDFKDLFKIARPTEKYHVFLQGLRQAFVGPIEVLGATLSIMCELAATSLQEQGLITPPWRTKPYLCKGYQSAIEEYLRGDMLCTCGNAKILPTALAFFAENSGYLEKLGYDLPVLHLETVDFTQLQNDSFTSSLNIPILEMETESSCSTPSLLSQQLAPSMGSDSDRTRWWWR